jgi:pimeloyl-ACP methyl ester carboxylesterase
VLEPIEFTVEVTDAAALGEPCSTAVTAFLPEAGSLADSPVVCFAFPGGGYSRRYYSFDMPGSSGRGQAGWHVDRGWIFVAVDHLGVGDSTLPDGEKLTFENVARSNVATVEAVMAKLAAGTLSDGYPPVAGATKLGIGQSMGGCFLIVAQGQHGVFDGIGVLGYSAIHTIVPSRPGTATTPMPWMPRGSSLAVPIVLNQAEMASAQAAVTDAEALERIAAAGDHPFTWAFHFDDEPPEVVAEDMATGQEGPIPSWRSATTPPCAILMVAPGAVAAEAAAIRVPVLVASGERDVVPDPWMEPKAFKSANDITVFVCPRMAHMHNFARTRERLWARLHHWGEGVAQLAATASNES